MLNQFALMKTYIEIINVYGKFHFISHASRYAESQRNRHQASSEKKNKRKLSTGEGEFGIITDTPKRPRVTARRRLQEQREKLMGAMALIELAEQIPSSWIWPTDFVDLTL